MSVIILAPAINLSPAITLALAIILLYPTIQIRKVHSRQRPTVRRRKNSSRSAHQTCSILIEPSTLSCSDFWEQPQNSPFFGRNEESPRSVRCRCSVQIIANIHPGESGLVRIGIYQAIQTFPLSHIRPIGILKIDFD